MKRTLYTIALLAPLSAFAAGNGAAQLQTQLSAIFGKVAAVGLQYGNQVIATAQAVQPSDAQMAQIKTISEAYKATVTAIQNDTTITLDQKTAALNDALTLAQQAIKATLTPAQIEFLAKMQQPQSIQPPP